MIKHDTSNAYEQTDNILSYRELLWAWTGRTVRARYKQSLLGIVWAVIQPAARALILTVVFTRFIPIDTGDVPYVVFSYIAWVPWTLFSSGLADMVASLVTNMSLVTKIYFPREILPLSALFSRLFDAAIAGSLLVVMMFFFGMSVFTLDWLWLPIILFIQVAFMSGLGLAGAALNVFYRDIIHLFTFIVQLMLYATPIIYPVSRVPSEFLPYYQLNPMVGIIEAYRAILLNQTFPVAPFLTSTLISLAIFIAGYALFKRLELDFADVV